MHPAYSVIFFTTASGAGYGLLTWIALAAMLRAGPSDWSFGLIGLGIAFLLITGGLLSSTAHLGRPERAWRAISQWRSSWLSREGVLAIATYIPAGIFGIGWVFFETTSGIMAVMAFLSAALAIATVYSTGMIYASLPTIKAWHQPLTVPVYITLALASGGILYLFLASFYAELGEWMQILSLLTIAAAFMTKFSYWQRLDEDRAAPQDYKATGLEHLGRVRQIEAPHTQENFVMREMGFTVARKHAEKLRRLALLTLFAIPALCILLIALFGSYIAPVLTLIATLSMAAGLLTERWLFFAEARHVVMLYYGQDAA
ncbi:MAG: DmsC/YnfH family molybdoenzyme membrane anchor subunit [Filomicrobium sp.]